MRENDYLDDLIEAQCGSDPQFARDWQPHALMLDLSAERVRLGLTQAEVASRMGVARPTVVRMENAPEGVSLSRIARYAAAIGASLKVVPGRAEPEEPVVAQTKRRAA